MILALLAFCPLGANCSNPLVASPTVGQAICQPLTAALRDTLGIARAIEYSFHADSAVGMPDMTRLASSVSSWTLVSSPLTLKSEIRVLQVSSDRLADNRVVAVATDSCLWEGGLRGTDLLPDQIIGMEARWNAVVRGSGLLEVTDSESARVAAQLFLNFAAGWPVEIDSVREDRALVFTGPGAVSLTHLSEVGLERTSSGWRFRLQWPSRREGKGCTLTVATDGGVSHFVVTRTPAK